MSTSNHREQYPNTFHHLFSRIAHQVRFLDDESKDDFLERVFRMADFSGIKVIAWCIMTNHFHLLVFLPQRPDEIYDEELKRRFAILQEDEAGLVMEGIINKTDGGDDLISRMYDIGEFMKVVKQNFTMSYNRRTDHSGTMWDGPYHDPKISQTGQCIRNEVSYINLNPIRACLSAGFCEYPWSSMTAAKRGDRRALEGLRFAYEYEERIAEIEKSGSANASESAGKTGNESAAAKLSDAELIAFFEEMMEAQLEGIKLERAEAVMRKRMAGIEEARDPLTEEAMVAQVAKRLERIQGEDFRDALAKLLNREVKDSELKILRAMAMDPTAKFPQIAKMVGVKECVVKYASVLLQKVGAVARVGNKRNAKWQIKIFD